MSEMLEGSEVNSKTKTREKQLESLSINQNAVCTQLLNRPYVANANTGVTWLFIALPDYYISVDKALMFEDNFSGIWLSYFVLFFLISHGTVTEIMKK